MQLMTMDLVVRDVPAATRFFTEVVGLQARFADDAFAELEAGGATIMLTAELMVPSEPARGVAVHFAVDDVTAEVERLRAAGATVLLEPTNTDWGTEMAMIAGPEQIVVSLFR
ncbi:putative enzyme related to lactoylglutathione lyase [Allocatelliglobosispora scoriae]|uniref:Putative enzyme related to lactoylglutathione lyase n=1 Tax=Allocatelliglobosispora scoriae TaxID=643052 RepID=A0A841BLE4_9ACTN|nr:VOC family protein [Allocatelliglobosispora scoriae]MBB5868188.1 putative enzyme related to lactoylglutathione lyase [Allocatelliglobosispora scoriae]